MFEIVRSAVKKEINMICKVKRDIHTKYQEFHSIPVVDKIKEMSKNIITILFLIIAVGGTILYVLGTGRLIVIAVGMGLGAVASAIIYGGLYIFGRIVKKFYDYDSE